MRLISVGALGASAVVVMAAAPVAAKPLEREHYTSVDTDTFTDTECGAAITIDYPGNSRGCSCSRRAGAAIRRPTSSTTTRGVETFTNVANEKTATIKHQGLYKDLRIVRVEGTIYLFTAIETGRPVVVFGPDGERLIFDRGRIRYSFAVDTKGDADLSNDEFVEGFEPDVAGPHPIFFDEADFCDLLDLLR